MSDNGFRNQLRVILAADAAGYSRLMAADAAGTVAALDGARAAFKSAIESHQGRVIDMAGDSVLAVFDTAAGAVRAALEVQQTFGTLLNEVPEDRRMRFRIGLHLGDVMEKSDGSVYGDGVNIAARLQGLAEPGGIMVSDAVRGAVKGRIAATFGDLGEQAVKNIADPVHVFSLRSEPEAVPVVPKTLKRPVRRAYLAAAGIVVVASSVTAWLAPWRSPTATTSLSTAQSGLTLPKKPSIAVLPFENMSGDPDQSYFADGISEDLITDLSKVAGLFVIARNSTFVYKGKAQNIPAIAKALGVRYVLKGSVRRSGTDIRVNAQLIDATTGDHVWADRYDGDMKNIFGLQDKVASNVVAALAVELTKEDKARVSQRGTANAEAYDVFLKGWQHYQRQTPENFRAAIVQFKRAVELDPKYGRAFAALAATYWEASRRYWDVPVGLRRNHDAYVLAEQFLSEAKHAPTPLSHQVASAMLLQAQHHDEAIAEARRAIEGDPSDADGYVVLAEALSFSGKASEALEFVERAIRLNPHYPPRYLYEYGLAQFGMQRFDDAASSLERAMKIDRNDYWSQRLLLSTFGLLGRDADARSLLSEMLERDHRGRQAYHDPMTIKGFVYWYPFARAADAERFADGLRKAGVPE